MALAKIIRQQRTPTSREPYPTLLLPLSFVIEVVRITKIACRDPRLKFMPDET